MPEPDPALEHELPSESGHGQGSFGSIDSIIGFGSRVVCVGIGDLAVVRGLSGRGCRVTSIERDAELSAEARLYCEDVVTADLDVRPFDDILPRKAFDFAVFGDAFGNLREPARTLEAAQAFLAPGGSAIISLRNLTHGNLRLAILDGASDYHGGGLFSGDRDRRYTLTSIRELCMIAGYRIAEILRDSVPLFASSEELPAIDERGCDSAIIDAIRRDPDHETVRFVVRATALGKSDGSKAIVRGYLDAEAKLMRLESRCATLESELMELRGRLPDVETERRDKGEVSLAAMLAAENEELRGRNRDLEETLAKRLQTLESAHVAQLAHVRHEAEMLRASLASFQEREPQRVALEQRHELLETEIAAAEQARSEATLALAVAEERAANLEHQVAALAQALEELRVQYTHLETSERSSRKTAEDLERERKEAAAASAEAYAALQASRDAEAARYETLSAAMRAASDETDRLKSLATDLERRLASALAERDAVIRDGATRLERAHATIDDLKRRLRKIEAEVAERSATFEETAHRVRELHELLAASRADLAERERQAEATRAELSRERDTGAELRQRLAALTDAKNELERGKKLNERRLLGAITELERQLTDTARANASTLERFGKALDHLERRAMEAEASRARAEEDYDSAVLARQETTKAFVAFADAEIRRVRHRIHEVQAGTQKLTQAPLIRAKAKVRRAVAAGPIWTLPFRIARRTARGAWILLRRAPGS